MGEGVLGNISVDGCECVYLVYSFQVSHLPQLSVYPLFTCITFLYNHQKHYYKLQNEFSVYYGNKDACKIEGFNSKRSQPEKRQI